jgi:hypothetical protein
MRMRVMRAENRIEHFPQDRFRLPLTETLKEKMSKLIMKAAI